MKFTHKEGGYSIKKLEVRSWRLDFFGRFFFEVKEIFF